MIRESISLTHTINFLNDLLKIDRVAVSRLFLETRVDCKKELSSENVPLEEFRSRTTLGFLGVLNALFSDDDLPINMVYDEDGHVLRFEDSRKIKVKTT